MDCPACHASMIVLELDKIEIDHCLDCRGIWLDAGELELLLENSEQKNEVFLSFHSARMGGKTLTCPLCPKKMDKVSMDLIEKIIIDKCPDNHGLWFDLGELEMFVLSGGLNKDSRISQFLQNMFSIKNKLGTA